jgi:hypothetical protein
MRKLLLIFPLFLILVSSKPIDGLLFSNFTTEDDGLPTDSLKAYYPFNGNANDESGNGNNGTARGATLTSDRDANANSAYNFNGTSDDIYILDASEFNINTHFTLSAWLKTNTVGWRTYFTKGENAGYGYLSQMSNTGTIRFIVYVSQPTNTYSLRYSAGAINDNAWHHVVCTYNTDGTINIYIDNSLSNGTAQGSGYGAPRMDSDSVHIGKRGTQWWSGDIDDVRLYNRILTTDEIEKLYNE